MEKKQMPIRLRKECLKKKQLGALEKAKGILNEEDYPEFSTSDDAADWVRKLREESDDKRKEL